MNTCLKIENISKSYGQNHVLGDITLNLKKGEIISLLGASAVGKTTLFNIIAGLLPPDNGEILLNGEEISNKTGKISYMLQKDLLLPYKTIIENVSLPLILKGMNKKEAFKQVDKYFKIFEIDGCQHKYPKELSGGMCQRVAFLRTYICGNDVVLLDEPFSAIDAITKKNLQKWYLEIMSELKLSTIFITHDIDEAIFLSNRIYILADKPAKITKEFEIKAEKTDDFILSNEFLNYKREILSFI